MGKCPSYSPNLCLLEVSPTVFGLFPGGLQAFNSYCHCCFPCFLQPLTIYIWWFSTNHSPVFELFTTFWVNSFPPDYSVAPVKFFIWSFCISQFMYLYCLWPCLATRCPLISYLWNVLKIILLFSQKAIERDIK